MGTERSQWTFLLLFPTAGMIASDDADAALADAALAEAGAATSLWQQPRRLGRTP